MSVNKYTNGELVTLSNGTRAWVGTLAAHDAAKQAGTLPRDAIIYITDDDNEFKTDQVVEDSQKVITSGGVYDALNGLIKVTQGTSEWTDTNHSSISCSAPYPTGFNMSNSILISASFYYLTNEAYIENKASTNGIFNYVQQTGSGGRVNLTSTRTDFVGKTVKFVWLKIA